jgi:hypothetical protein
MALPRPEPSGTVVAPAGELWQVCRKENAVDEQSGTGFKPPYFSFQTFWAFVNNLASKQLPPVLDRSFMDSKSGTDQQNLWSAMQTFGLVDANKAVLDPLREFAKADESGRKAILERLVRENYPEQMRLSEQHGSGPQLNESFGTAFGINAAETKRKAATFFLHAARTAGLTLSENFPSTRTGSGSPGTPRRSTPRGSRAGRNGHGTPPPPQPPRGGSGETKVIDLGDAGTITVTVNLKWLELPTDIFVKVRQIIDDFEALGMTDTATPAVTEPDERRPR